MSFWRFIVRSSRVLLPLMLMALVPLSTFAASGDEPGSARRNYIVTLKVADAGKAIAPTGRDARSRIRRRAAATRAATDRLTRSHGFRTGHRYSSAISGFSARLTSRQAQRLQRDSKVASIRPARRYKVASQVVPTGIKRSKAAPSGGPRPDVDADIAVLDTGIGPVGNGELNLQGGINCSGDSLGPNAWQDVYSSKHGTHVAGTAAARDNAIGTVGVAPGARLWSVRVFRSSGFGDESTIVCGLDWAVSTHGPGAPPGTQPIDVINMSLQGPRPTGAPEACIGASDPDAIHAAVCTAYAAGITIVVAAGNDATNAANISPAGYDQVITVGALSDFDGLGDGQATSRCEFYETEPDDSFARYSNHGGDVDILAPGTCIVSTQPTPSGDATATMTGTSMASPHVAGAVARYLAANPATTPNQMRKLVRAAGRLDWKLKTDPHWSGANDLDEPNRVLDVKALTGAPGLRTWVSSSAVVMGGSSMARTTRVDVQRLGGYAGAVTLGVEQLPGAVGSASFDRPGASLSGLAGLGARLTLSIKPSAPDGVRTVKVTTEGPGGVPNSNRDLGLLVDYTGPETAGLHFKVRGGRSPVGKNNSVGSFLEWKVGDELSSVKKSALQRKIGTGGWKGLGTRNKSGRVDTDLKPGPLHRFRVRSTDKLGNVSVSPALAVRLTMRDSRSTKLVPAAAGWHIQPSGKAIGGSLLTATKGMGRLSTTFDGTAVAVVAPLGPKRGKLRLRVDGGPWRQVSLKSDKGVNRRVVYSRDLDAGSHTLEIAVQKGKVALDAIVIVR